MKLTQFLVLTRAEALPYTIRTGGQRRDFGEMSSGWAGKPEQSACFASLFDSL
jgi:hypothetical protein